MSNSEIDIHMSDLDEETKRIQKIAEDAQNPDDSKESKKEKKHSPEYETNTLEDDDSEW